MGGSFERLTASGKPTHYHRHSKESPSPTGLHYILFPVRFAHDGTWLRQLMAVFWSPLKTGRGSPVRHLTVEQEHSPEPAERRPIALAGDQNKTPAGAAARREAKQARMFLCAGLQAPPIPAQAGIQNSDGGFQP